MGEKWAIPPDLGTNASDQSYAFHFLWNLGLGLQFLPPRSVSGGKSAG